MSQLWFYFGIRLKALCASNVNQCYIKFEILNPLKELQLNFFEVFIFPLLCGSMFDIRFNLASCSMNDNMFLEVFVQFSILFLSLTSLKNVLNMFVWRKINSSRRQFSFHFHCDTNKNGKKTKTETFHFANFNIFLFLWNRFKFLQITRRVVGSR